MERKDPNSVDGSEVGSPSEYGWDSFQHYSDVRSKDRGTLRVDKTSGRIKHPAAASLN